MLRLGAKPHDIFDASPIVPAAIENHDFARRGEQRHITLQIQLRLLSIGGRRQRHHPEDAVAHSFGDRLDDAALAGGVAPLEDDDHTLARRLDPILQGAKLHLQLP
ncbi:MAG: hypothetical protein FD172_3338 [Methylocystaceae bacterium]|nr:MAG: hypothetical protein FD172_3338 [Methylocystaceae bacterium]